MHSSKQKAFFFFLLILVCHITSPAQTPPPANPTIRKADSLFLLGDWNNARSLYLEAAKTSSLIVSGWSRLGFSNYNLGNYDEAMQAYQKVLSMNAPVVFRGITFSRMAKVYAVRNDKKNVFIMLDSAINNGYSNLSEMDTLKAFDYIRNDAAFQSRRKSVLALAMPCMADPHAREFDFWIGEWDVSVTGTTAVVGHSLIQMISNGCALLENWDSPGSNGKSINYIDPVTNKWKQAWAGSYRNGIQEFVNGEYKDGAMRFNFEYQNPQGKKIMGHFIFYNEKPGQVRQFNETSADAGKTWVTSYDYTYIKRNKAVAN